MTRRRRNGPLANGPGALTQALGVTKHLNTHSFNQPPLWIEESGVPVKDSDIMSTPRIGVDYAGKDALLPWRFILFPKNKDIFGNSIILAFPDKMKQNVAI